MRIAVVGAGAVGGYFGARLAQGGAELVVIARGAHLEAIRHEGLRLTSVAGDAVVHPAECAEDLAAVAPADVVLLGVKAWQVADAAGTLRPLLARDGCVLPLQNGVEAPGHIDRALGPGHALGGLATLGAVLRLDTRTALRLDAQQYFFSGGIADSYTPHLGTTPLRSVDARARHDFVLLAGFSWRAD